MSNSGGFAVVLAVLCAACVAPAGGAAPARMTASGAQAAGSQAAALICRTERPTGSNIPRRVCYTQEELDEASQAAQDAHRRAIQGGVQGQRD